MWVEVDRIHVEMFQGEPDECSNILTARCHTVGLLAQFPNKWKEGTLCPHINNRRDYEPVNFLPFCLLSHARTTIDATILAYVGGRG